MQKPKMFHIQAAIPAVIKPDPPQEVVQKVIRYNLCGFFYPIQKVLKLLKRTISVTHWIVFFDARQCHWTGFQASCCKHSRAHSRAFFVLDS